MRRQDRDGGCAGKVVRQGLVVLTPGNGKCIMVKTIDNASNLFKKSKNIDGLTVGWSNKPFPQWWV
jgi:hypothetical protein